MRPTLVPALLLLSPLLALPGAIAASPALALVLPVDFDVIHPGRSDTIAGTLTVTFPDDSTCDADVPYTLTVRNAPTYATISLDHESGVVPRAEARPGATWTRPVLVSIAVAPNATAYDAVHAQVRVRTEACGNLSASQGDFQGGTRVGYIPRVRLTLDADLETAWRVKAENLGNAASRLDWLLTQPDLGRVLSGASARLPGPDTAAGNFTTDILISKAGLNVSAKAVFTARINYDGVYPAVQPPDNTTELVLYRPPGEATFLERAQPFLLGALAVAIMAAVILVGARFLRRQG